VNPRARLRRPRANADDAPDGARGSSARDARRYSLFFSPREHPPRRYYPRAPLPASQRLEGAPIGGRARVDPEASKTSSKTPARENAPREREAASARLEAKANGRGEKNIVPGVFLFLNLFLRRGGSLKQKKRLDSG
jgi:hypothetical protein